MIVKEGVFFAVPLLLLAAVCGFWLHPVLALPWLVLSAFVLWFFRDPDRRPPDDPSLLVCPADGKIIRNEAGEISIFMNVFDVHVCRAPMAGRIESAERTAGGFLAAWKDAASESNERAEVRIAGEGGLLRVTLVAGLVARRIVLWTAPERTVGRGERIGLIRFGSRVDLALPEGFEPRVRLGQRVRAGETALARFRSGAPSAAAPGV